MSREFHIVTLVLLLIGILILLAHPSVFNTNTYMDVNSGDVRVETAICGLRVRDNIRMTPFSQEIRRLGIPVPENPAWRLVRTEKGVLMGTHSGARLGDVPRQFDFLIEMFGERNLSDQDRLVILQQILGSLKKKNITYREIGDLVKAVEREVHKSEN